MSIGKSLGQWQGDSISMLAKITGLIDSKSDGSVVIDVNGIGYLVHCSSKTISSMPLPGEKVSLLLETVVREDAFLLYGFEEEAARDWFKLLQTVKNVGARVALAILSISTPEILANAIINGNKTVLTDAPGVGPKLAERIISELKDKAAADFNQNRNTELHSYRLNKKLDGEDIVGDAVSALLNLGYGQSEAVIAVQQVLKSKSEDSNLKVPALIRESLKELSK